VSLFSAESFCIGSTGECWSVFLIVSCDISCWIVVRELWKIHVECLVLVSVVICSLNCVHFFIFVHSD
jgi:hypothetical protein